MSRVKYRIRYLRHGRYALEWLHSGDKWITVASCGSVYTGMIYLQVDFEKREKKALRQLAYDVELSEPLAWILSIEAGFRNAHPQGRTT